MKIRNPVAALRETLGEIATAVNASAEFSHCAKASAKRANGKTDAIVL